MSFIGDIFKGPPKPPAAPDPTATIQAQKEAQQIAQFTPQGNLVYGSIGANGQFTPRSSGDALQVTESPYQKQFREGSEQISLGLLPQLQGDLGQFRSAGDVEGGINIPLSTDVAGDTQGLVDAMYQAGLRQIQPDLEQSREGLIQNLADRGIPLSSEAAQRELDRFDRAKSNTLQDLAFNAIGAGQQEQQRQATLAAALRGQQVNEGLSFANLEQQQRAQRFGEIGALGGFAAPFQPLNAPTVDVAGIINQGYANQLSRNNIQSQNYAKNLGFAGDIIGAAAGAYGSRKR